METRNLGRSGLRVSAIGLGCNNFGGRIDEAATKKVVHKAFDLGITLFDTADVYGGRGGSETALGKVIGTMRHEIVLATKFCMAMSDDGRKQGASRRYIMQAVEASLTRLQTDHIDLYQVHRFDELTPVEETLRALDDLVRSGKVRYIGCSNWPSWRMMEASWIARTDGMSPFVSCQDEYSLVARDAERELMPAARALGLGMLPYFPLAGGLLTGKYRHHQPMPEGARLTKGEGQAKRYLTDANWEKSEKLIAYAAARGHTALELAFSWLLARAPVTSVIAGATKPEQVEQNVRAGDWVMSAEEVAAIDAITA